VRVHAGLLRFVAITTLYEGFSFMGAMQFGVYRLVTDLGISQTAFGWLCSASAVCGLGAIALVAKLSTTAVRKTHIFCAILYLERSFYHDRLGTDKGKTQTEMRFFQGVHPTLCGIYGCQSVMLLVIGLTDSPVLSLAAFFVWRCLDR
jgi:hypothetical protein